MESRRNQPVNENYSHALLLSEPVHKDCLSSHSVQSTAEQDQWHFFSNQHTCISIRDFQQSVFIIIGTAEDLVKFLRSNEFKSSYFCGLLSESAIENGKRIRDFSAVDVDVYSRRSCLMREYLKQPQLDQNFSSCCNDPEKADVLDQGVCN